MFFRRNKLRRYTNILFIDSENVGYQLPDLIPKDTYIYLFIPDMNIKNKLKKFENNKQIEFIVMSSILKDDCLNGKNALDFCLVVKLSEVIRFCNQKQNLIILSKDKGYDAAIQYILNNNHGYTIQRVDSLITEYFSISNIHQKILKNLSETIQQKINQVNSMEELKAILGKKQKNKLNKNLTIKKYKNEIIQKQVIIHYDLYQKDYVIYSNGTIASRYPELNKAVIEYETRVKDIKKSSQMYNNSSKLYKKAKDLNITDYVEDSYQNHQSLQQTLINEYGKENGLKLLEDLVSAC